MAKVILILVSASLFTLKTAQIVLDTCEGQVMFEFPLTVLLNYFKPILSSRNVLRFITAFIFGHLYYLFLFELRSILRFSFPPIIRLAVATLPLIFTDWTSLAFNIILFEALVCLAIFPTCFIGLFCL